MRLPVVVVIALLHKEPDVVNETNQNTLLVSRLFEGAQELTAHVLASLTALTVFVLLTVTDVFVKQHFLDLLLTIVVQNGLILLDVLCRRECTVVGRRGRPRALSVLGLIRVPGGCIRERYLAFVFLLDVGEEGRIGEVPLAAGTPEFPLGLLLVAVVLVWIWRVLFAHELYINVK